MSAAGFLGRASLWASALLGFVAVVACGSSSGGATQGVQLADGVTVIASAQAGDVQVLPDRLLLSAVAHPDVVSKTPGSILAGERAPQGLASGGNPRGFLRKVVSVSKNGEQIVVMTQPATLLDVVHRGSMQATLQLPELGTSGPVTQSASPTLHTLGGGGGSGGISLVDLSGTTLLHASGSAPVGNANPPHTVGYDASLVLKTATLDFTPKLQLSADIEPDLNDPLSSVQSLSLVATGTLAADLEIEAKLALTGNPSNTDVAQLIAQEIFKSASTTLVDYPVDLGAIALGPLNVPATAEFKVTVACDQVKWGGATDVVFGGKANASITAGFQYDASSGLSPVLSHSESLSAVGPNWTLNDEISAHCWIQPELDLSLFDVASGMVWADAWGAMSADAVCSPQQTATGELQGTAFAGISATAEAKVDVFGLFEWQKECTLFAEDSPHLNVDTTFTLPAGSSATCVTPGPAPAPVHVDSPPASCFGGGSGSDGTTGSGSSSGGSTSTGTDDGGAVDDAGDGGGMVEGDADASATDAATDAPGSCDHDVCTEGDPLSPTCKLDGQNGVCIQSICQNDPYCCTFAWTGSCVAHVTNGDYACTKRTCP